MDRFARPLFACGLGLFLTATGCRSTQPEVPPSRSYTKDGQPRQAIQFSSEAHPTVSGGTAPYMPNNLGNSDIASGISGGARPDASAYGAPPGSYGAPGTAGTTNPMANLTDPSTTRASSSSSGSIPLTGTPPSGGSTLPPLSSSSTSNPGGLAPSAGPSNPGPASLPDLNVTPPRDNLPSPSQTLQTLPEPGTMGSPGQLPSPN